MVVLSEFQLLVRQNQVVKVLGQHILVVKNLSTRQIHFLALLSPYAQVAHVNKVQALVVGLVDASRGLAFLAHPLEVESTPF